MDRAVGVWPRVHRYTVDPLGNAFINEYALLMAGDILRTEAWIFMHELWSVTKSDVIVHEKEGRGGISVMLVYFYSFVYTFFLNLRLWMVNDGLQRPMHLAL
jgi:hypothetical protein